MTSRHYEMDRQEREALIQTIGYGKPIARFVVDRNHPNGAEIHEISDTAILTIYNQRTGKLITKIIARPNQIRRYYPEGKAPKKIVEKAIDNIKKNPYNI